MEKKTSKYYETARLMDEALLVLLEKKDGDWWYTASNTCTLEVNKAKFILTPTVKPLKLKDF